MFKNEKLEPVRNIAARALAGDPQAAIFMSQLIPMPRKQRPIALVEEDIEGIENFRKISKRLNCAIYAQGSRVAGHWIETSDYDIGGVDYKKNDQIITDIETDLNIKIDPKKHVYGYAILIQAF